MGITRSLTTFVLILIKIRIKTLAPRYPPSFAFHFATFAFDCTFACDYSQQQAAGRAIYSPASSSSSRRQKATQRQKMQKGEQARVTTFVLIFSPPPFAFALHSQKQRNMGGGDNP
jgi:hypothetical protein